MPLPWSDIEAADMAACRALLRDGSRSFAVAGRLLPRTIRDPAMALYAFCRQADDAIDRYDDASAAHRGAAGSLEWLRDRLALAYEARPQALPTDRAFALVVERFAIPRALPEALLDGLAWDAEGRLYEDLASLRAYAVRVAGSVGAMMAVLMGVRDAERLGVAMQLSNIARDVGEDARAGRLYLPLQWLAENGIDADQFLAAPRYTPALGQVLRRLLNTAHDHYRWAEPGIARLPLGCRFGIGAARLLYAEIGQEVTRRGFNSVSGRAVVSGRRKAWVLASGLGGLVWTLRPSLAPVVPEGHFLLKAVAETAPPQLVAAKSAPRWAVTERICWTIDLFERLEQRERVKT